MMYRSVPELIDFIKELLSDADLLQKVASNGYELAKQHTYLKRAQHFLEDII
jgi:spore maturation protein CgeB